jgi:hypothetical protein
MNNKAHTILVSVIASYGSRLTTSTANCKAFLADFLTDYADEKNVLVELHNLQLTKALYTFKGGAIDKKTLINFIEQLETRSQLTQHDLSWGVDAWANAVDIDIKARRSIRKQCFSGEPRDLHAVTIRPIETAVESAPEVPAMIVENASQAAIPRMALMGVVTLVSTFSIFQAVKSVLPMASEPTPIAVVKPVQIKTAPTIIAKPIEVVAAKPIEIKSPRPEVVVIKSRTAAPIAQITPTKISHAEDKPQPIDIEKLSGKFRAQQAAIVIPEPSIDVAAVTPAEPLPEAEDDKLHADIEAFLTQDQ